MPTQENRHASRSQRLGHPLLPACLSVALTCAAATAGNRDDIPKQVQNTGNQRPWGPEQSTGPPNTPQPGDLPTAWASHSPNGQEEWLSLEYDREIVPLAILVYETHNPGALAKVSVFESDGTEVAVWTGDPGPVSRDKQTTVIPFQKEIRTNRVKLHIASGRVPGWNEIDAVGLVDSDGVTHWAAFASASSTWAERAENRVVFRIVGRGDEDGRRIDVLEHEVKRLQGMIEQLTERLQGDRIKLPPQ